METVRNQAEAAFRLVQETAALLCEEDARRFWKHFLGPIVKAATVIEDNQPQANEAMTEDQAKAFERVRIPWGKESGISVKNIELEYLFWMADERDKFKEALRRYLRSDRVQREQEEQEE